MPLMLYVTLFCILTTLSYARQGGTDQSSATNQPAAHSDSTGVSSPAVNTGSSSDQASMEDERPKADEPAQTSAMVPGQISGAYPALVNRGQNRQGDVAKLSMAVKAFYDDNGYDSIPSAGREWQYSFVPGVSVVRSDSRSTLEINYGAGVAIDELLPGSPAVSQSLFSRATYDLSQHVHLTASQGYSVSNNPFDNVEQAQGSAAALRQPGELNPFVVTAAARETTVMFAGNLAWQLGPHDTIGLSGGHSTLQYDVIAGDQGLGSSDTSDAHAYYVHLLSVHQSAGLALQWQDFGSGVSAGIASETRGLGVQYLHIVRFSEAWNLSLYAGPEKMRTTSTGVSEINNVWLLGGGGALTWRRSKFGVRLGYDNGPYDGGGRTQAVHTQSGNIDFILNASRKLNLGVDFGIGDNNTFATWNLPTMHYRSTSASFLIERELARDFWWRARYMRITDTSERLSLASVDHNRVQTELAYSFSWPFGAK
jgi:hypothetical protein